MTENLNELIVVAFFDTASQADGAAADLMRWDGANEDIKLGAIGMLSLGEDNKVKIKKYDGPRNTSRGAKVGVVLGLVAGVFTGGITLLGGALAGTVLGSATGSLSRKRASLTEDALRDISSKLGQGRAAVVAMCDDHEAEATMAELKKAGGVPESYGLSAEALKAIQQAEINQYVDKARHDVDPFTHMPIR